MTRETLDDTVDRIAAALTAVPPDPGFSQRLRPKLDGSSRLGWMAVSAAAAVIALAILATLGRREPALVRATAPLVAVSEKPATIPSMRVASPRVEPARRIATAARAPVVTTAGPAEHGRGEPVAAIPALAVPDELDVGHLILPPLVIDAVALESLGTDTIAVPALGAADPKE